MKPSVTLLLVLAVSLIEIPKLAESENILFFFGLSTYSHRITAWPLATKLAEQGHSVTFLQSVKNKNPHKNVTDIVPDGVTHMVPPNFVDLRMQYGQSLIRFLTFMLPTLGINMCRDYLNNEKNIEWINSNKFDLVIIDALFNDCAYGLAWKWKAKTIVFGTTHVFDWFPDTFGFADESATSPSVHFADDLPLSFYGRLKAQVSYIYFYWNKRSRGTPPLNDMLREKLNMPEMPQVEDLVSNTSLVFINSHYSEELPKSLPPLIVPVGGMHVSGEVKPLPKEMEDFVKGAGNNGFIYVSFGSEADMAKSPDHIREIFWKAISKTKARFLWKWNGDRPKEMPDNVLTSKWMPQQDILGHPKCRGFITHGGLLSMQEAVYFGVPMAVFPIFAEQDYNAERLQRTGRGIRLEIADLTQSQLDDAINRLLTDKSLKEQMNLASIRFKDRPQKPVETALWWVHYILRHDDTSFLRPLAINLTWYQRRQLDVWGFLALSFILVIYAFFKLLKFTVSLCTKKSTSSNVSKNKKKN